MAKQYIQPDTQIQHINHVGAICIGSVQGTENFQYGGGTDGSDPDQIPM